MNNYYYKSTPLSDIMETGTSTITHYNITTAKATTEPQAIISGGVSNFFLDNNGVILNSYSGKKLISGDTTITAPDWVSSYKVKLVSVNGNKGDDGNKGADGYEQPGGSARAGGPGGTGITLVSTTSGLKNITKNQSITTESSDSIIINEGATNIFTITNATNGNKGQDGGPAVPRTKGGTPARCGGYRSQNGQAGANATVDGTAGSNGAVTAAPADIYTSTHVSTTTKVIELYGFTN